MERTTAFGVVLSAALVMPVDAARALEDDVVERHLRYDKLSSSFVTDNGDRMGTALAAIGDVATTIESVGRADLAVGLPNDDDGGTDRGAVFIDRRSSTARRRVRPRSRSAARLQERLSATSGT